MYSMNNKFMPSPQVLARIAEAFSENDMIKKTHMHFASRTDWNSFEKYLKWMQDKNYIEYHNSNENAYKLTNEGREIFNTITNLYDNIKKFQSLLTPDIRSF